MPNQNITLKIADQQERSEIYRYRHEVYAAELHQHHTNAQGILRDAMDAVNVYIIVKIDGNLAGFVSITPPGGKYGLDKYMERERYPFLYHNMYEGRLFTVIPKYRGTPAAMLLFLAVFRYAEYYGGEQIMTIGRLPLVPFYEKTGLIDLGESIYSGEVEFKLMYAPLAKLREYLPRFERILRRVLPHVDNRLVFPLMQGAGETHHAQACYHGGAFFSAVGETFRTLAQSRTVINADVLDAWFDPAPAVLESLREYLPWISKTSPPTQCGGLIQTIAETRCLPVPALLAGAGSSSLIYLAFPRLLQSGSRVLLLNPTYGEYAFVLENVVGAQIDAFPLCKEQQYRPDTDALIDTVRKNQYDMVILVNPNSPTGTTMPYEDISRLADSLPQGTRLWIDETYVEFAGIRSMERYAADSSQVIVCKSMSKGYALSGLRCAYLTASPATIQALARFSPPWAVSLPAQIAAVKALHSPEYYASCYQQTHENRAKLARSLRQIDGIEVLEGDINAVLCFLPERCNAAQVVAGCARQNVFLRDVQNMGQGWTSRPAVRIAVKSDAQNQEIVNVLKAVLRGAE